MFLKIMRKKESYMIPKNSVEDSSSVRIENNELERFKFVD